MTAAARQIWVALQTRDLPEDSTCTSFARADQAHIWHAWNDSSRYCDYHHLGGLKAPVARVVKNRQQRYAERAR